MNILYISDDNFVLQIGTSICSLCENNKNAKTINFYIMPNGILISNQKQLIELVKKYNRNIKIIELGDLDESFGFKINISGWNKTAVARLLMSEILPQNLDKIIYLDGDTVVRNSLEKLWNIDMGNKIIGG